MINIKIILKIVTSLVVLFGRSAIVSTFLPLYTNKTALLQMSNIDFIPNFEMYTQTATLLSWVIAITIILLIFRNEIKNKFKK